MTRRRKAGLIVALLIAAGVVDDFAYPALARPSGRIVNRRANGLWIHRDWAFGTRTDYDALARRIRGHGIGDAYFHVRSLLPDGRLRERARLTAARWLNQEMKRRAPSVRRIAWIYAGNRQGRGGIDLSKPSVRAQMASEAAWLVRGAGFDGVQWDYEICPDGDPNLLRLLEETRTALPKGAFLGAAVPTWYPPPFGSVGWSEAYFREVARRCDGMAVMAYDSAMLLPRAYVGWVTEQTIRTTRAAHGTGCRVVIGLPTYGDRTLSHNPDAENLRLGLLGVRNGLAQGADLAVWQGVGLFADYTTDGEEWATLDRLWPLPKPAEPTSKGEIRTR